MQYVQGITLRSVICPEGLPLLRTALIVKQIGHALAAAHKRGILHRDLKPENIMVQSSSSGEFVRLIDFGIAAIREEDGGRTGEPTRVVGTPAYMAPEQLRGQPLIASDIYAMGVIVWEMLVGKLPPNPASADGLRLVRPDVSERTALLICKAIEPEPSDRFAQADEFAEELAAALGADTRTPDRPVLRTQQQVLDVAAAREILIYKPAEVVALVRRSESGGLAVVLEEDNESSAKPEDVRSKRFQIEFPVDGSGNLRPLELGLRIECPDFEPKAAFKLIEVPPDRDSEPCSFLIRPQYLGPLHINVELMRGNVFIAARILKTEVLPSDREPDETRVVVSIPLQVAVLAAPAAARFMPILGAAIEQTSKPSGHVSGPDEFTRMFNSLLLDRSPAGGWQPAAPNAAALRPEAVPSAPEAAQPGEGEFKRMFNAGRPAASAGPQFPQTSSPPLPAPVPIPEAKPVGEFMQMFGKTDIAPASAQGPQPSCTFAVGATGVFSPVARSTAEGRAGAAPPKIGAPKVQNPQFDVKGPQAKPPVSKLLIAIFCLVAFLIGAVLMLLLIKVK
jgi:serine/threonine protein kinase